MLSCGLATVKARITESPRASEVMKLGSLPAFPDRTPAGRAITRASGRRLGMHGPCAITAHHRRSPPLTARARMSYRPSGLAVPSRHALRLGGLGGTGWRAGRTGIRTEAADERPAPAALPSRRGQLVLRPRPGAGDARLRGGARARARADRHLP